MALINIGIAGCLGRMGQELVKESLIDSRLNLAGGFENPLHKNIPLQVPHLPYDIY